MFINSVINHRHASMAEKNSKSADTAVGEIRTKRDTLDNCRPFGSDTLR